MFKVIFMSLIFVIMLLGCRMDDPAEVRMNDGISWVCQEEASCEQYNFSSMTETSSERAKQLLRVECPQMKEGSCKQNSVEQCQHSRATENSVGTTVYLYKYNVPKEVRLSCRGDWKKL